jgi:hypothetical protein
MPPAHGANTSAAYPSPLTTTARARYVHSIDGKIPG